MTAEKDQKARAIGGFLYTPLQMTYVLFIEMSKDPNSKHLDALLSSIEFLEQLPPGTMVRFDPKTSDIQVRNNRGEIKTG